MQTKALFVTVVTAAALSLGGAPRAQTTAAADALVGAWTLNKPASDLGGATDDNGQSEGDNGRAGNGSGLGGGRRRGGFGGGGFGRGGGGGGGGAQQPQDTEARQRLRDALRQELQAPDHMTLVSSGTTMIITTPDGHTTRLSTDGKKVKDDSTGIERKTKWEAGKLVSEVNGLGRGKITETYSFDPDSKQLRVKLDIDGPRKTTQTRVYDLDAK